MTTNFEPSKPLDDSFLPSGLDTVHAQLPVPTGWRLLVKPLQPNDKTASGLYLPAETVEASRVLTFIGQVIDTGDLCYTHPRYHNVAFCKEGDWVAWGNHTAGIPILVKQGGQIERYILLNDDEIVARLPDPNSVRIYV